eukprot:TRINITY_DN54789_c0_g1_i1.p1 TRINITY_DN54789_c0_g1~~TRINITY_DN54789_c0_g1_i1.p1  ORF type:complete len:547 (-),score=99.38 TRINITY_DN54789_c0_g1_i1:27-1667(-)
MNGNGTSLSTKQIEKEDAKEIPTEPESLQELTHNVVSSLKFDILIGTIIVANAMVVAWEQSLTLNGDNTVAAKVLESFFLVIYLFEIGLRYYAFGFGVFHDTWVKFDCLVVFLGILTSWILEPTLNEWPDGIGLLVILRLTRLLRIIKTLRVLIHVREFWMLVRGFAASLKLMFYTFFLVFVLIYVFGIIGVEIITKHRLNMGDTPDSEFQIHVDKYFSTLPMTMLTLMRFACMDEMASTFTSLVQKDALLSIYFVALIICLGMIVMNIVGAVIFNGTLEMNKEEEDAMAAQRKEEMHKLIQELRALFLRLDEDNSGTITRDEIKRISPEDNAKLTSALGVSSPVEVFSALDADGSGRVSIEEFFDSIVDVALKDTDVDMKRLERQLSSMSWRLNENFLSHTQEREQLRTIGETVEHIKNRSNLTGDNLMSVRISADAEGNTAELPPWAQDILQKLNAVTHVAEAQVKAIVAALNANVDPNGAVANGVSNGAAKSVSPANGSVAAKAKPVSKGNNSSRGDSSHRGESSDVRKASVGTSSRRSSQGQ